MIFTVQNKNLDLITEIYRSKEYYDWLNEGCEMSSKTEIILREESHCSPLSCPIGTVEFCEDYFHKNFGIRPRPINIPECLFPWAGRRIINNPKDNLHEFSDEVFIKSNIKTKSNYNGLINKKYIYDYCYNIPELSDIQISSKIPEINSEFRVFIYREKIIDMKQYSGDPFEERPEKDSVEEIIKNYKGQPVAYTLDLWLEPGSREAKVMEIHNFYGCGLYGFDNHQFYPFMLWRWFREYFKA